MSNKQDISKLLKTIEENFNVHISSILKNDFCLACYFSLIGEKEASKKILDNIIDAVSLDKRKTYFINIKDSIDEHAVTYAKEINASCQIINLIDYLTEKPVKNQTMSRKQYITALYSHFTGPFLVGLAEKSPSVLSELERCRCKIDASHSVVLVEFQLGDLFDALWCHAVFSNINLPSQSQERGKDFKEFCRQLTISWPITWFKALGFHLELLHKSNSYARSLYRISPM